MKAFFGSMTGRVFLVLLLGMLASAALTQWLAVAERQRAIAQYRDFQMLERAEQLVMTVDLIPAVARDDYLRLVNRTNVRLDLSNDAGAGASTGTGTGTSTSISTGTGCGRLDP